MDFDNKFDDINWSNTGAEPSDSLQSKGFEVGYKPSAGVFNWFWSKVMKAITEIQTKLKGHSADETNPHKVTASQVGLGKVDNTADSEKSVNFASEAGVGRKVENALSVLFNGGNTEGTDKWTFDGSASKSVDITADKIGGAKKDLSNVTDAVFKAKVEKNVTTGIPIVTATSTDGVTYDVNISDKYPQTYNGLQITIIPNMTSTTTEPKLRVTTKVSQEIITISLGTTQNAALNQQPQNIDFIVKDTPILITFNTTTNRAMISNYQVVDASDLYGTLPIASGGTGATTAAQALANLGGAKKDLSNVEATAIKAKVNRVVVAKRVADTKNATGDTVCNYTATVEGITELYNGLEITIIPDLHSNYNQYGVAQGTQKLNHINLNVNNLGNVPVRQPLSFTTFVATTAERNSFLTANTPCRLMYHENYTSGGIWLMAEKQKTSAQDLYGTLPIASGGTGATTEEEARLSLGVAPAIEDTSYSGCYYRTVGGVKEWINPPMVHNTEYKTTERYCGSPVYIKAFYRSETIKKSDWPGTYGEGRIFDDSITLLELKGTYVSVESPYDKGKNIGEKFKAHITNGVQLSWDMTDIENDVRDIRAIIKYIK